MLELLSKSNLMIQYMSGSFANINVQAGKKTEVITYHVTRAT